VKPGDLLIATANDFSFSAVLLIRGVDERNGLIVVAPLMGAAFEDQPILINIEIFIRKTLKKSVGVFKKFNGELELIKDGFAAEAEAEAWARRLGAHEVSLLKPAAATIEV